MKLNFRNISISLSWLWLGSLVLLPTLLLILTSVLSKGDTTLIRLQFSLANYWRSFHWVYLHLFLRSLKIAGITTVICLLIALPFANLLTRVNPRWKPWLLLFNIIPFWTNSIITTYAIMIVIKSRGLLNSFLLHLGFIQQPLHILYSPLAVYIGLVYNLLPFMVLPLYARLEKRDVQQLEAAQDLGASPWRIFSQITLPFAMPAIIAGCLFVFLPAMTLFFIPDLLGGAKSYLLGNLIQDQFISQQNWPFGASLSILLTGFAAILIHVYWRLSKNSHRSELI